MKFTAFILILILLTVITLSYPPSSTYAWLQTYEISTLDPPGFFAGLWHGLIAPFAVFAQIFDHDIILYSPYNSGLGYNLGFLLGFSIIIGGGGGSTYHQVQKSSDEF